jgi:hypothetical protein
MRGAAGRHGIPRFELATRLIPAMRRHFRPGSFATSRRFVLEPGVTRLLRAALGRTSSSVSESG